MADSYYKLQVAHDTPIAWYRLQETSGSSAVDSSTNGNTATYGGGITLGQANAKPVTDVAPLFDGIVGRVNIPDASQLHVTGTLTLEAWFNASFTGLGVSAAQMIWSAADAAAANNYFGIFNNAGNVHLLAGLELNGTARTLEGTTALAPNTWYYVALVWDGSRMQIYLNGVSEAVSSVFSGPLALGTTAWSIGARAGTVTVQQWFAGSISEFAAYTTVPVGGFFAQRYSLGLGSPMVATIGGVTQTSAIRRGSHITQAVNQEPDAAAFLLNASDFYKNWILNDAPAVYWRLQETTGTAAIDSSSGGTATGTYSGVTLGALTTAAPVGDIAPSFVPASTSKVTVADVAAMHIATSFTVEGWIYPTFAGLTASAFQTLWSADVNANNYFGIFNNAGNVHLLCGMDLNGVGQSLEGTTALSANTWYHVALTWTTSDTKIRLYVNGVIDATSAAFTGPLNLGTAGWRLGQRVASGQYWAGYFTEVAAYGSALTAAKLLAHNNIGRGSIVGLDVKIGLATLTTNNLVFGGTLQTCDQTYEGTLRNGVYRVGCVDYSYLLSRRYPIVRFSAVSASTVVTTLIGSYASGFTTTNVAASLASISIDFDGSQDLPTCLTQIANRIGGYWYIDYGKDLHFFLTEVSIAVPNSIDTSNTDALNESMFDSSSDETQIQTRVYVIGAGGQVDVGSGNTFATGQANLPLTTQTPFSSGQFVSGPQRCSYTGVSADNGKATVSGGIPQSPGTLSAAVAGVGGNIPAGGYNYKVVMVNAKGDESEPGSAANVNIVNVTGPGACTAATNYVSGGGNLTTGGYAYAITFLTAVGETLVGTTSGTATITAIAQPNASTLAQAAGGSMTALGLYYYMTTYVTAAGETLGAGQVNITLGAGNRTVNLSNISIGPDARITKRRIYRSLANPTNPGAYGTMFLVTTLNDNSTTTFSDTLADTSLGGNMPATDTSSCGQVSLSSIPTSGDARVTKRRIYRTPQGGTDAKLVGTIADNSTTTFTDNVADSALGQVRPLVSTADNDKISLTSIATGGTGTTARHVYRSPVTGGGVFKYLLTLSDNTTTIATDNTPDTSLGVDVPTVSSWRTSAGATTLPVVDTSKFSEGLGWVKVSNQIVVFSGRSTTSGAGNLTGIPASGVGSLVADVTANTPILCMPFLKGVSGQLYTLDQGASISISVQRDDATAQAAAAAREGGDGIHENTISDSTLTSVALCNARGDAQLALFKNPINSLTFSSRDSKLAAGRRITVTLGTISQTYTVQRVVVTEVGELTNTPPRYAVTASSMKFTLNDLLRQLGGLLNAR